MEAQRRCPISAFFISSLLRSGVPNPCWATAETLGVPGEPWPIFCTYLPISVNLRSRRTWEDSRRCREELLLSPSTLTAYPVINLIQGDSWVILLAAGDQQETDDTVVIDQLSTINRCTFTINMSDIPYSEASPSWRRQQTT